MSDDLAAAGYMLPASPFTTAQAIEAGMSPWRLRQLVRDGALRRPLREVYVDATLDDSIELRARSAALVVSKSAVVTDRSAAWLWGVDALRPVDLDVPPPLEIFVLRGDTRVRRGEVGGGVRDLSAADITVVEGVSVTTPVRTSLDLGCRLPRYEALAAMDALSRSHHVGPQLLASQLPRFRRRRGVIQLRSLVGLVDARAESSGESFARLAILDAGLPPPQPQFWVVEGETSFRLDLAYPRLKVCVEYDGQDFHSTAEHRAHDARRRNWLGLRGWIVIVVTKDSFSSVARDAWISNLRRAIEERTGRRESVRTPSAHAE
jgi:hypothetical protein